MTPLLIGTALFFLGGFLELFIRQRWSGLFFTAGSVLAQLFILPSVFQVLKDGNSSAVTFGFSLPIGTAFLRMDPLAAFFALIISLGGLLAALYSLGYMKMYRGGQYSPALYYFFMGLLVAAMLLVVSVQNALLFLIVWEIMSLASFFLVSFEHHKE
jgi:hydrogenase-4 component B